MRTPRQVGLIVEGNSTHSILLRLSGIAEEIGPIKATTKRVARRVSNFLRAGRAVENYEDLENCDLILMRLPDAQVRRVVAELTSSQLNLSGISFVLCETWLSSDVLRPLVEQKATIATTVAIPSSSRNWFAIEGQYTATKRVTRLLEMCESHAVELKAGTKHLYFAANILTETLPRALFTAGQRALRECGLNGNHLYVVLEEIAQCMIRDMTRGSRAGWSGAISDCPEEIAEKHLLKLRERTPELASFISEQMRLAAPYTPPRIAKPSTPVSWKVDSIL